jgi:hypothetical protein
MNVGQIADVVHAHPRWRKAALLGLALLAVAVAIQSARLGAAGFHAQSAHRQVAQWSTSKVSVHPAQWHSVQSDLRASLRYVAANPAASDLNGTLALARMRASTDPGAALAAARSAHAHFRQALLERPTSPFLWANLALTKMYLDQFDAEMFAALRNADALGPWEPGVQLSTVLVGLAAWHKLEPAMREALARTVERAGIRSAERMLEVVKGYGRFDLVCGNARYTAHAAQVCAKAGAPSQKVPR